MKNKLLVVSLSILAFTMQAKANDGNNIQLLQASKGTSLSSEECANKSISVLKNMGFPNASSKTTLKNWKKVEETKDSSHLIKASNENTKYTIFCKASKSDIVMFTIVGKDADSEHLKEVMDRFSNKYER